MAPAMGRRVSYVIPPPSSAIPKLSLPPLGTARDGRIGPILLPATDDASELRGSDAPHGMSQHPRHRLGVAAFALDTATQLAGRDSPEGILYTGGRDGLIMAWDLGMPMKRRSVSPGAFTDAGSRRMGRWERLTRDEEDDNAIYEEEDDDEWPTSDGDVIGDVREIGGRRGSRSWVKQGDIPYEQRWETDIDNVVPGQPTQWRQSTQAHTDWINDILLCNLNQTVISGSSDGTVKAWNPHSPTAYSPMTIGTHSDYVRCLTQSRERNWIASGSFDRSIKIWDILQPRSDPVVTLLPPESSGPKSSVYALATDPFGHVVASGGPERVVRTWDPRSGKRIGKLVGHTDNIRAILMSEDSRYLLTGSADASIKLWSILSPQRCIYTFTHHTESVWSLFSAHPALEVFYSGDRSGLVSRVDVEECDRLAQGECTVLCRDNGEPNMAASEGVSKIISMDDHLVWTASGSSSIRRWRVPQSRIARASAGGPDTPLVETSNPLSLRHRSSFINIPRSPVSPATSARKGTKSQTSVPSVPASFSSSTSSLQHNAEADNLDSTLNGIPYESLVKLSAPNSHHHTFSIPRNRESDVATLYSAASVKSAPRQARSPSDGTFPGHAYSQSQGQASGYAANIGRRDTLSPLVPDPMFYAVTSARAAYEDRDVAVDAVPLCAAPDLVIEGAHGLVRVAILNDRIHAVTVDTSGMVAVWDIVRGLCVGAFAQGDVRSASAASSASSDVATCNDAEKISPRQALEIVRERIEGEAVVLAWASADTRIGELTIHILDRCFESEIFADEAGYGPDRTHPDDLRLNIGKWVLRNLFVGFIREEQRMATKQSHEKSQPSSYKGNYRNSAHPRAVSESLTGDRILGPLTSPSSMPPVPALPPDASAPGAHPSALNLQDFLPIAQSPAETVGSEALPTPRPMSYGRLGLATTPYIADGSNSSGTNANIGPGASAPPMQKSPSTSTTPSTSTATVPASSDYFSLRRRPSTSQSASSTTQTAVADDDFSGWGGPGSAKNHALNELGSPIPSTPGGFMGRLKNLGKNTRRAATEVETPSAAGQPSSGSNEDEGEDSTLSPQTFVQRLKSQISPPPTAEAPPLPIPSDVAVIISEELPSGWMPVYRGLVGNVGADVQALEEALPSWLLEFLLTNKAPAVPVTKLSFILLPAQIPPGLRAEYGETLPELLNTSQSKLSASRFLRVKKLAYHIQDKLDRTPQSPSSVKSASPRSSTDTANTASTANAQSHNHGSFSPASDATSRPTPASSSSPASRSSTPRLSPNLHLLGHGTGTHLPRAEDAYEILCNDQVLPLEMTLAAVRQFVWRQSSELVMHYRRKPGSNVLTELDVNARAL
ncbi:hypothetical protein DFH11DRAFT_1510830 [Phellopilus nigrolimitatus]|nr:hypothetical protein DFH11DRAFT_1510830 [Phellopilus nigrolimitatus]